MANSVAHDILTAEWSLVFCDEQNVRLCLPSADGEILRSRTFPWSAIKDVCFLSGGLANTRYIYIFLRGEQMPAVVDRGARGLDGFLHDISAHGIHPHPLTEIVFWSAEGKLVAESISHEGCPSPWVSEDSLFGGSQVRALVYPATSRWVPQLVAALPKDVHLAHMRRAGTVAIYLQMRAIRMAFMDISSNDELLQQVKNLGATNLRGFHTIVVNSTRDNERAAHLLSAGLAKRILQLPLRQRVVEGLTSTLTSTAPASEQNVGQPVLVVTHNPLLTESLRDELESYHTLIVASDDQQIIRAMRDNPIAALFVDIAVEDSLFIAIAGAKARYHPSLKTYGIRDRNDPFRASQLLARQWVHRIIDSTFDPRLLARIGLIPSGS